MPNDHELLQGFWKLVGSTYDGAEYKHPDLGTVFQFIGNRFRHVRTRTSYRFELHPNTSPKGMDLILVSPRRVARGLYELDGDVLRIMRANNSGRPRPVSFIEANRTVETYTRFKRRIPIKRRVKAQIPQTIIPGGFIPKGLLEDIYQRRLDTP